MADIPTKKGNNAKKNYKIIIKNSLPYLIVAILILEAVSAIPSTLTLQGKLTDQSGAAKASTKINFTFKMYDAFTNGNVLWQDDDRNITTDANGIYDVILYNLSALNFSDQYYLGITVGDDNESAPRINLTSSPYAFRANVSEQLNRENKYEVSVFNITGNLTLGTDFDDVLTVTTGRLNITYGDIKTAGNLTLAEKITFSFGAIIDNLVSNVLKISGRLNVTGNVTIAQDTLFVDNTSGRVGIGTASPNTKLTVIGGINASGGLNVTAGDVLLATTSGRVGIGTTGPINILTVAGDVSAFGSLNATFINATQIFMSGNLVQTEASAFKLGNVSNYTQYQIEASAFKLGNVSNYTQYQIEASAFKLGNVSNDSLKISGNASMSLWNASGSNIFLREITGSVGIGNASPDNRLTITGTDVDASLEAAGLAHFVIKDSFNTTLTNIITLDHLLNNPLNATNPKAGVRGGLGLGILFRAINNESEIINVSFINATLVDAANASEAGALTFYTLNRNGVESRLVPKLILNGTDVFIAPTGGNTYINPSGGSVGIGTTNPNAKLTIVGGANISGGLNVTNGDVLLAVTAGSVGIGTIFPNTKLEVNGTSTFGGNVNIPSNNLNVGGGYSSGGVTLVGTGTDKGSGQFAKDILIDGAIVAVYDVEINKSFIPTKNSFVSLGNLTNKFLNLYVDNILNNGTITANTNLTLTGNLSFVDVNNYIYQPAENTLAFGTNQAERVRIDSSGRVGIGTTAPTNQLEVRGGVNISGGLNVTAGNVLLATSSGSVGIGTASPAEKLVVIGKVNISDSLNVSGTVEAARFIGDGSLLSGISTGQVWNSSGANVFLNETTANVGIGTIKPDNRLTIIGTDADSYTAAPGILHLNVTDSQNTSLTNIITLDHLLNNPLNASNIKAGVSGGIGLGILFRAINNESEIINVSFINATLVNARNTSEASALTFYTLNNTKGSDARTLVPRLVLNGTDVFIAPAGQGNTYINPNGGSVGIGTASPINALTVAGDVSTFGSLNATFINATEVRQGLNQVQTINAVFNLVNYSAEYASTGFKRANVTDYLGEDGNASLLRAINISKDLAKSFSNFNLGNVSNYTQYIRSTDFNLGNISNRSILNKSKYVEFGFANISAVNATNVTATNITAARFTGKLDCGMVDGGSDSDYCIDGGGGANFWNSTGETAIFTNSTSTLVGIGAVPDNKLTIVGSDADSNRETPGLLHLNITDSYNTSTVNLITLDHLLNNPLNASNIKAGVSGGIGLGILFRAINNISEIINVSFINATLVDARNGSEAGALTFYTANVSGENSKLVPRLVLNGTDVFIAPTGVGKVGIGKTSPNYKLDVAGTINASGLHIDGNANVTGTIFYGGNLTGYGADFAEMMLSDESLQGGDVVCFVDALRVKKCDRDADKSVAGVVSSNPTIIGNSKNGGYPIGIVGLVKTNVLGHVDKFDLLTTSTQPGYAKKASKDDFGAVLGKSLEACGEEKCTVNALVSLS